MRTWWIAVVVAGASVWIGCSPRPPRAQAADATAQTQEPQATEQEQKDLPHKEHTEVSHPDKDVQKEKMPALTPAERHIIVDKGTERPFTGKYWNTFDKGYYVCRQCGAPLYTSASKFRSECGWPSFDQEIPGAVKRQTDADGRRTEILCAACGGHLGHVFEGEKLTPKNVRHCVNSVSLVFKPAGDALIGQLTKGKQAKAGDDAAKTDGDEAVATAEAIFAGGCFWGVEHHLQQVEGVISVTSGYTGGTVANPTYEQVCTGKTGHAEAVKVVYDPKQVGYEALARLFFEIHDPTQVNRQGPDLGTQYRSAVFYGNKDEKAVVEKLIGDLRDRGYKVVTEVKPAAVFYPAEEYHQDYLARHPGRPDCHVRVRRFDQPRQDKPAE